MHNRLRLFRPEVAASAWTTVLLLVLLLLVALAAPASAQTFPKLTGRVVDQANLLSNAQELDLESKSAALEASSGRQFVVATVNSLEGRTIEDYGYRLGRAWGIGREKEDDGVILLVAPNEKKVRIETGYGARVFLTDAISSVIVRNDILPRFRQGDMAGGIMAGAEAIVRQMSVPPEQARANIAEAERRQARSEDSPGFVPVIAIMIIFFVILASLAKRAGGHRYRRRQGGISPWVILWGLSEIAQASGRGRRRGGWGGGFGGLGGGGGGGGFGGFSGGGGSFGGGGASGGW